MIFVLWDNKEDENGIVEINNVDEKGLIIVNYAVLMHSVGS